APPPRFGGRVTPTTAPAAGVGHVIAMGSVALDTDTRGVDERRRARHRARAVGGTAALPHPHPAVQWSENATADSFGKISCSPGANRVTPQACSARSA